VYCYLLRCVPAVCYPCSYYSGETQVFNNADTIFFDGSFDEEEEMEDELPLTAAQKGKRRMEEDDERDPLSEDIEEEQEQQMTRQSRSRYTPVGDPATGANRASPASGANFKPVSPLKKRARTVMPDEEEQQDEEEEEEDELVTDEEFYTATEYEAKSRFTPTKHSQGRTHGAWTLSQVAVLEKAMQRHGAKWSTIEKFYRLQLGNRGQISYVII
jgi:hypothetical protein